MGFAKYIGKVLQFKSIKEKRYILLVVVFGLVVAGASFFTYKSWFSFKNLNYSFTSLGENNEPVGENNKPEQNQEPEPREVIDGLVIIRNLDKELIKEKIEQGKEFLFRMEHPDEHGFYKRYDAPNDYFEDQLHTVYSASIIYTFLYLYDYQPDQRILDKLSNWGDFLLSMQNKDINDKRYGAFHYSYYLSAREKEQKFVVGTSALSIFTLLRLYEFTNEPKYLDSAKLAGDWLITMQRENGSMKSYVRYTEGKWVFGKKESLLYNGQCLSGLSKLYIATGEEKYYNTAKGIADRFAEKYEESGGEYIQGEYRRKNPISNSWAVMSLMDFYKSKSEPENDYYKNIVFNLSKKILANQIQDVNNVFTYGQWKGAYSTSGIGWICEVMTDTYRFCLDQKRGDCEQYKEAVLKGIRWIIQNTYSEENSSDLPNSEMAKGGIFWNKEGKYVRTDSVCHGLNGYTRIINYLKEGILVSLPKTPI